MPVNVRQADKKVMRQRKEREGKERISSEGNEKMTATKSNHKKNNKYQKQSVRK